MTKKTDKWSESEQDHRAYTKIIRKLMKKLTKSLGSKNNPKDYDLKETIELTKSLGYCLSIKAQLAQKSDWEQRIKYLEGVSEGKQTHEAMNTR